MSCVTWEPKSTMRIFSCMGGAPAASPRTTRIGRESAISAVQSERGQGQASPCPEMTRRGLAHAHGNGRSVVAGPRLGAEHALTAAAAAVVFPPQLAVHVP